MVEYELYFEYTRINDSLLATSCAGKRISRSCHCHNENFIFSCPGVFNSLGSHMISHTFYRAYILDGFGYHSETTEFCFFNPRIIWTEKYFFVRVAVHSLLTLMRIYAEMLQEFIQSTEIKEMEHSFWHASFFVRKFHSSAFHSLTVRSELEPLMIFEAFVFNQMNKHKLTVCPADSIENDTNKAEAKRSSTILKILTKSSASIEENKLFRWTTAIWHGRKVYFPFEQ